MNAQFLSPLAPGTGLTIQVGGQVSCGFPSPAADHQQPELSLDELVGLGPRSSLFLLRAWGESMREAGIFDGDVIVVDKARTAREGDIVVAIIDSDFIIKTVGRLDDGTPALFAANPAYPAIPLGDDQSLHVWGVCVWNLHRLGQ